jgi:hypothetical protein
VTWSIPAGSVETRLDDPANQFSATASHPDGKRPLVDKKPIDNPCEHHEAKEYHAAGLGHIPWPHPEAMGTDRRGGIGCAKRQHNGESTWSYRPSCTSAACPEDGNEARRKHPRDKPFVACAEAPLIRDGGEDGASREAALIVDWFSLAPDLTVET